MHVAQMQTDMQTLSATSCMRLCAFTIFNQAFIVVMKRRLSPYCEAFDGASSTVSLLHIVPNSTAVALQAQNLDKG